MSPDSLWPHGLQHIRLPCPSPTPGACSNSCPSSQWCHPTILSSVDPFSSCLQSFPDQSLFQCISSMHQVAKYWSFSFSISPSNKYSGLISFSIEWLDLTVQEAVKSLLQYHSSKASILRHSAFFMVQLSHPYFYIFEYIALIRYMIWKLVSSILLAVPSAKYLWVQLISQVILTEVLRNLYDRNQRFLDLIFSYTYLESSVVQVQW